MSAVARQDMTVHVLLYGSPLCAFTADVPRDWPQGHAWISLEDFVGNESKATCESCSATARVRLA